MKRVIAIGLVILMTAAISSADGFLEGSAIVGNAGDFPAQGVFVTTSAFARNSIVEVRELGSQRTTRAIVLDKSTTPGMFMVLSPNAARELSVRAGQIVRVRALPVVMPGMTDSSPLADMPFHPDPDINPSAEFEDPNMQYYDVASEEPARQTPVAPVATPAPVASVAGQEPTTRPLVPPPAVEETPVQPDPQETAPEVAAPGRAAVTEPVTPALVSETTPVPEEPSRRISPEQSTPVAANGHTPQLPASPQQSLISEAPETSLMPPVNTDEEKRLGLEGAPLPRVTALDGADESAALESGEAGANAGENNPFILSPDPYNRFNSIMNGMIAQRPSDSYRRAPLRDEGQIATRYAPPVDGTGYAPEQLHVVSPSAVERADAGLARVKAASNPLEESDLPIAMPKDQGERYPAAIIHAPTAPVQEEPSVTPALVQLPRDADAMETRLVVRPPLAEDATLVLEPAEPQPPVYEPDSGRSFAYTPEDEGDLNVATPSPQPEAEPAEEPKVAQTPVEEPVSRPVPTVSSSGRSPLPLVDALQQNRYYVQIGAFGTAAGAKAALDTVGARYPQAVTLAGNGGGSLYRVFIGPLTDDEKGMALLWFRSRGYGDAFVRKVAN